MNFSMAENDNNDRRRRIDVDEARRMLGMIGRNYSDDEITEILECLYGSAEETYERFESPRDANDDGCTI